jgi:hypothetical protein
MLVKNSNDTNGNRSRDLPACSAVIFSTRPLPIKRDWDSALTAILFLYIDVAGGLAVCSRTTTGCLPLIIKMGITVGLNWNLRMGIRLHHHFRFTFMNVILIIDLSKFIFFCSVISHLKSHKVLAHSHQSQPYFRTITFIVCIGTCWRSFTGRHQAVT